MGPFPAHRVAFDPKSKGISTQLFGTSQSCGMGPLSSCGKLVVHVELAAKVLPKDKKSEGGPLLTTGGPVKDPVKQHVEDPVKTPLDYLLEKMSYLSVIPKEEEKKGEEEEEEGSSEYVQAFKKINFSNLEDDPDFNPKRQYILSADEPETRQKEVEAFVKTLTGKRKEIELIYKDYIVNGRVYWVCVSHPFRMKDGKLQIKLSRFSFLWKDLFIDGEFPDLEKSL